MNFKEYLNEGEQNWWQHLVVQHVLQPHKLPFTILSAALQSVIGAGVGAARMITRKDPYAIPKNMVGWGLGAMTNWQMTPKWSESTVNLPPDLQTKSNELIGLAQTAQKDRSVMPLLIQKSKEFYALVQQLPRKEKEYLANSLQSQ